MWASLQRRKKVVQVGPPPVNFDFLQKPPKVKRTKVMSRFSIAETLGNLCVEIVRPIEEKNVEEAVESDSTPSQVDLHPSTTK